MKRDVNTVCNLDLGVRRNNTGRFMEELVWWGEGLFWNSKTLPRSAEREISITVLRSEIGALLDRQIGPGGPSRPPPPAAHSA